MDRPSILDEVDRWSQRLAACLLRDGDYFSRELNRVRREVEREQVDAGRRRLERLARKIETSEAVVQGRHALAEQIVVSGGLPISNHVGDISAALDAHQVVVVCGDTGSGKTTQLPKICLAAGRGRRGTIGHTQPRRIAARSVAKRIASEVGSGLGRRVGYKVRFDERIGDETVVKLMTDGILLAELERDRDLRQYDTLIIDEAHERSLNIDLLLGVLKRILKRRADLKVIITSATIDPERFSKHFEDAPIIEIPGRTYPVEVRYAYDDDAVSASTERDLSAEVRDSVRTLLNETSGDILVFLPGERDIRETAERLRGDQTLNIDVLPLYARLNASQQERVFAATTRKRVILATNVAETSLTVPNVHAVVDTGLARISRYSVRTKVQRLPVEMVSQASAEQRKGRCGRVGPGICVRLYSESQFESRPPFTDPEIRRTNLASVILKMHAARLGRLDGFPFLDPPNAKNVRDGYRLLRELGALDARERLTPLGRQIARLPVDPRIGRMVIAAADQGSVREVLVIAAALSVGDPRDRPFEAKAKAEEAHGELRDPRSDFMTLLRIWTLFRRDGRNARGLRALCKVHYLSFRRMVEWRDVHRQLTVVAGEIGVRATGEPASFAAIHRALLSGLLGHIGVHDRRREYRGVRDSRFVVTKGSGVRSGRWVVAAELVETSSLFAHTAAKVRPEWIEQAAGELAHIEYFEPYWDRERGEVMAYERVTLFGLTVIAKRRIRFAPRDPLTAWRIFIREALVAGAYSWRPPFRDRNEQTLARIRDLEVRSRRTDIATDEEGLARFFEARIPQSVASLRTLKRWYEALSNDLRERLVFADGDVTREGATPVSLAEFPDAFRYRDGSYPLRYRHEARANDDGITVRVPLAMLRFLNDGAFSWMVPGYLRLKVDALLRALPKSERRRVVPIPDTVQRFIDECQGGQLMGTVRFEAAIAGWLRRTRGVSHAAVEAVTLPEHLAFRYEVTDGGDVVARGRNFAQIEEAWLPLADQRFQAAVAEAFGKGGLTAWTFGELPREFSLTLAGYEVTTYPAIVDAGHSVSLDLLVDPEEAARATQAGVKRLFMIRMVRELDRIRRSLPDLNELTLKFFLIPERDHPGELPPIEEVLIGLAVEQILMRDAPARWTETEFRRRVDHAGDDVRAAFERYAKLTHQILDAFLRVRDARAGVGVNAPPECLADIDAHLVSLVHKDFLSQTPVDMLEHLPRYLEALHRRVQKVTSRPERDRESADVIGARLRRWQARMAEEGAGESIARFRWRLEELRVSLFAQDLGTVSSVSPERLDREWGSLIDGSENR
ncbi:MAG: ATP-dependent RNA helicase HrpA [Pseudomonadota bacterium]